ncbi:MAG: hypothetical protein A3I38_00050 [Candidatus Wildermuthbacteria bacterium RIFCSPLOWO2_02_FULL_47_10]|uniref:Uncharacterized protein n=2 Tax=Candidatus Wildermuthiibacteriota TaxID=1817923 RepID=A0A1G2R6S6_9BACT|nr:MAG: hypothetical protein UY15_C0037G0005 [Parcubacteria group bacterium GW2011_GWA2_47_9]OHA68544.1 MAG: hypothetical protein A3D59_00760 [Candidatus Wildermuthbacteria bacterium RIFCSPHIGHO2_02_FULL_47_17]OHA76441.1 MAG: hypothetical protein A3I38_00050 [Candidatus Wildermuthbacteria bacterium RIFCSPLOWO2_02_FULL_47_10]
MDKEISLLVGLVLPKFLSKSFEGSFGGSRKKRVPHTRKEAIEVSCDEMRSNVALLIQEQRGRRVDQHEIMEVSLDEDGFVVKFTTGNIRFTAWDTDEDPLTTELVRCAGSSPWGTPAWWADEQLLSGLLPTFRRILEHLLLQK